MMILILGSQKLHLVDGGNNDDGAPSGWGVRKMDAGKKIEIIDVDMEDPKTTSTQPPFCKWVG